MVDREEPNFSRTSFTQSLRRSWTRLQRSHQEPRHNIMPDEPSSESAVKWIEDLRNEIAGDLNIPYIDDEGEELSEMRHLGIQSRISELNFTDEPPLAELDTYRSQDKETKTETETEEVTYVIQRSKSSNVHLQPYFQRIFRTKSKPLNVDAGSPLRLPSWYYAGIGKHGIPRSSTFPDTIQTNQGSSPRKKRRESIIEQAELKGAFGHRNSVKKRVMKRLQLSIQSIKQDPLPQPPQQQQQEPPPLQQTSKQQQQTQRKQQQQTKQQHKQEHGKEEKEVETKPERDDKEAVFKRRVSFEEDNACVRKAFSQWRKPSKKKEGSNSTSTDKKQAWHSSQSFCKSSLKKPHPSERRLIRSMSDVATAKMGARQMRNQQIKDPKKKKMMKEWSKNYEGMCIRAQKLEQAIECAEKDDMIVKPVHQIEAAQLVPDTDSIKKTTRRRSTNKGIHRGSISSFISICSISSCETVYMEETLEPSLAKEKSRSYDMSLAIESVDSSITSLDNLDDYEGETNAYWRQCRRMNQPINQSVSQDQASDGETNEHVDNVEFINETKECIV